ncbi:MAG TPA: gliding motility-associated ABC transporter ATP-binding subunit GldA, partial [Bacteroidales bacterium]|nr:gliding motility-associated ABC transporter ATP-binding subunit GldA [Bacteroidales bacterium]
IQTMSIHIQNLTKTFGTQKAVNNISFEISKGEIVGFIGPNGAGKSTTMKIITGYITDFEGSVQVNGLDVRTKAIEVKKSIGYLPEHNPMYLDMYVTEYLLFVARMYSMKGAIQKQIASIIELTGLQTEQHKKIGALSKGYRQRVGLASVLIHNPQVLILDEPTTGLDPNQIIEIRNVIASVGKEKTVILSTHIMQEVEAICNRVIIINNGSIVANNDSHTIKQSQGNSVTISVEFLETCSKDMLMQIPMVADLIPVSATQWLIKPIDNVDIRQNIFNFAVQNNITVLAMQFQEKTLEQVFQELTKIT